ncbi:hypothetical protein DL95DRAFT_454657 [Leptodontidium sp. 2 PMI_412]|nr:hypothetical protein BKA61DRAFT_468706 [Leptodontidium sp. MPI-SDFR-AT-0119]KAH9222186.1 hypothetical protein DL95DRAFT_454657 [Leptodontidium sp. 2 PMI_412]
MKFSGTLASCMILLASVINPSQAQDDPTCYGSGNLWSGDQAPAYRAGRAYKGYDGIKGAFQVVFAPGENKRACINNPSGVGSHIRFEIRNLNRHTPFNLNDDDCYKKLKILIDLCKRGGVRENAGWKFTYVTLL